MNQEIEVLTNRTDRMLPLASARLGDEYYYQSLPLCVIDAVFSIGVLYEGVRNVITQYCSHFGLRRIRNPRQTLPPTQDQESMTEFCNKLTRLKPQAMADDVFHNHQRTSSRNGILKAEAVFRFASILKERGIEYFQDIPRAMTDAVLDKRILAIRGQSSGLSLQYFWMLAGSDDLIKPDRMVLAFLLSVLDRRVSSSEAQELLIGATEQLKTKYPNLTPRLLDHEIWKYQRSKQ